MKNQLICFLGICSFFLFCITVVYHFKPYDLLIQFLMLTPGLCALLTQLLYRKKLDFTIFKPKFKKNWKLYIFMYFGIPILCGIGAIFYFIVFPQYFSPQSSHYIDQLGNPPLKEYYQTLLSLVPLAIFINPLFGLLSCLGEEYGWRGYLFPLLFQKYSVKTAAFLSSVIWGVWHVPILLLSGLNYGFTEPVFLRITMQILLCIVLGILFSYGYFTGDSIWIPVLGHAAINGLDKVMPSSLFMDSKAVYNPIIGPNQSSLFGMSLLIICSIALLFTFWNQEKKSSFKASIL